MSVVEKKQEADTAPTLELASEQLTAAIDAKVIDKEMVSTSAGVEVDAGPGDSVVDAADPQPSAPVEASTLPEGSKHSGTVVSVRESFGFIRSPGIADELFFHISGLAQPVGSGGHRGRALRPTLGEIMAVGDSVDFAIGRNKKDRGKAIAIEVAKTRRAVDDEGAAAPDALTRGVVVHQARGPHSHRVEDGLIAVAGEGGEEERMVPYGNYAVSGGALQEGASVEFKLHEKQRPDGSSAPVALAVVALAPSSDRVDSGGRELGRVSVRKQGFGFIKCCERNGDMFFHVSALEGCSADELGVGDDVEFSVGRDHNTKKLVALNVRKLPRGSAVFEAVSEEVYSGTVLERLQLNKHCNRVASGVIEYEADGVRHKVVFGDLQDAHVNPAVGEQVSFRITTNVRAAKAARAAGSAAGSAASAHAGRRATHVAPIRQAGRVCGWKNSFGFIRVKPAPREPAQTEADSVNRWGKKPQPPAEPSTPATAEAASDGEVAGDAAGAGGKEGEVQAAGVEAGGAEPSPALPNFHRHFARGGGRDEAPRDIFFHASEVEGDVQLKVGDEVEFSIAANPKSGEPQGMRVVRTPPPKERESKDREAGGKEGTPAPLSERRKLLLHATAEKATPKALYMPAGPDGTKGFAFGRGRGLPPPPAARSAEPPSAFAIAPLPPSSAAVAAAAATLARAGSSGRLDPKAAAFVPRSMSQVSMASEASFFTCPSDPELASLGSLPHPHSLDATLRTAAPTGVGG